ncbi:VWA domain-containing protein [Leptospira levettii]|uniref:VWA domain-containing protein n=1 Tax=Leptospira levettii TaxID=2023178 RepID=A0AAW5V4J3_9LEPT|nr:VWA domain-containing protein [Leptospira levettii]MCW7466805.1 VWA domain-containing protein [Leptospira levettii]MCW7497535.1 VWA domain-containing protein [Leptospira levettii]MCW7512528.1 VWA domain-containing protein [Leptospira levettii]MCW7515962.1 VWA domain-containing protein [Leptospira levettii]
MDFVKVWESKWEDALKLWSDYVKLSPAKFLFTEQDEKAEGLTTSFAAIRLKDHRVLLSVNQIKTYQLEDFALEILGHEIGHHVYCPGDLADQAKLVYISNVAMPRLNHLTPMIVNIYEDLFINDHLKRQNHLRMEEVYQKLGKQKDPFWNFYMRTYELLWALPTGTLTEGTLSDQIQSDAALVSRMIRNFPNDWAKGMFDFASICFPYFFEGEKESESKQLKSLLDTLDAGKGMSPPSGLSDVEISSELFPLEGVTGSKKSLTPSDYSTICKSMGIDADISEITYRYYKDKALPYLVPFPERRTPGAKEEILEGNDLWDPGSPIEKINWLESTIKSPIIIPGYTTVEDVYGETSSNEIKINPIDLDLFVDCSGSMPNPQQDLSYLTLAGAIIALSALKTGSSVRVTLWSGEREFLTTDGFIQNEKDILKVLTGYFGGGTCFPLELLEDEYKEAPKRKRHILVISDDGIDTMFTQNYPRDPRSIVKNALEQAQGGGSMVLQLYQPNQNPVVKELEQSGWDIYPIQNWTDLIQFSKDFVEKNYVRNQTLH